jgi:hypothetical protein
MYLITIILELTPDTDHESIIDFYERNMVQQTLNIPGVKKINCLQLRSTPYNSNDKQPLRNLFYQIQIYFSSEKAFEQVTKMPETLQLLHRFIQFSKCKLHWFIGHDSVYYPASKEK